MDDPASKQNPKLQAFKDKIFAEADVILNDVLPRKVLELDQMYRTELCSSAASCSLGERVFHRGSTPQNEVPAKHSSMSQGDQTTSLSAMNGGHKIPSNAKVMHLIERLKPIIHVLLDQCSVIRLWIQLLMPHVEDTQSIGVAIQEDLVEEISRVENDLASYLENFTRYFTTRAAVLAKSLKYPEVEDYRHGLVELDDKEMIMLQVLIREMRDYYCILHDSLTKNMAKIKKPSHNYKEMLY